MQDIATLPDDGQPTPLPSPAIHDIPHFLALLDQLRLAIPPPSSPPSALSFPKPLLLLHSLRPLHRSIHLQLDERRSYLQRLYRRGVDGLNIERASWQYEKDWFLREIERQKQYESSEAPIELISVKEFQLKYPDAPTDSNQLHIARLQDELAERKRLLAQVEQLQQRKAQLQQSNATQRQHLSTLTSTLTALYDSAAPLYATFFPSAAEQVYRPLPDKARELPQPLWQLFCTAWSYCSAFVEDDSVTVHVLEAEAKEGRKGEQGKDRGKGKDDVWAAHPLSVGLRLGAEATSSVDLRFHFLPALHLVTVLPVASPSFAATTDISWLLYELYPADDGSVLHTQHLSSLSPAVQQAVQSASPAPANVGSPYVWCQRLCGLHPPSASNVSGQPSTLTDVALADVLLLVQQRLEQLPVIREQLARHKFSPASDTASSSVRMYNRQYAASGNRTLSVSVEVPHSYPVMPPRFSLHTAGGGVAVDERKLRALESELNSADVGADVRSLDGLLEVLERQWAECV